MELRVLGASGGVTQGGATTAFLLDQRILLDGGTGVGSLTLDEMVRVEAVLLTHAHLDHIAGAALLLASVVDQRTSALTVYAPAEVLAALKTHIFNWQIWPDFAVLPTPQQPVLQYVEVVPYEVFELGALRIEAVPLTHTVPSYAYLIECQGRAFCFCGDTGPTEALWQRINVRADVAQLFIELSYPAEQAPLAKVSGHYDIGSLAQDLGKLEAPLQLHLMHAKPSFEAQLKTAVADSPALQVFALQHCQIEQRIEVL